MLVNDLHYLLIVQGCLWCKKHKIIKLCHLQMAKYDLKLSKYDLKNVTVGFKYVKIELKIANILYNNNWALFL